LAGRRLPVVAIEQLLMETSFEVVSMAWFVLRSMTVLLRIVQADLDRFLIDARVTGSLLISMGSDVFGI